MKRDIVVYISGKYSGKDYDEIESNIKKVRETAIKLWELGYTVLAPHLNTYHFETDCKCSYQDYIDGDLTLLSRCDAILMLDNWEESTGAKIEKQAAEDRMMEIFFNIELLNVFYVDILKVG
jgi:hypothetical protein